ncbi:hypothetical protein H8356DRAFT_1323538 [Neocallimastix lanati (nom. inval.)]|nr:hypothetical protein H8356DRAFT_1323538 [Neocallimastix sp. JGI-2020a]
MENACVAKAAKMIKEDCPENVTDMNNNESSTDSSCSNKEFNINNNARFLAFTA